MSESFIDDLAYLGKVLLITFLLLSLLVISKQKILEGILLLTFACQLILVWVLAREYKLRELLALIEPESFSSKFKRYLHIFSMSLSFIVMVIFIFRAIIIIQQSLMTYGSIRSDYHNDIILASIIGGLSLAIFIALYFVGRKYFKKTTNNSTAGI